MEESRDITNIYMLASLMGLNHKALEKGGLGQLNSAFFL